jgi:hypothetical protein
VLARRTCSCTQRITRMLPMIYAVNHRRRNGSFIGLLGQSGTYLSRSQAKGPARWRNRCRTGGGGRRIASKIQIVCAA